MPRLSAWTIIGLLLAMLAGTIHAFVGYILDDRRIRRLDRTLGPRIRHGS